MRRILTAILASGLGLAAVAQQPGQCVNPQLVNGLVFLGRSNQKVSTYLAQPGFMSDVRVTPVLSLIGSGTRVDGINLVAYKTSLAVGEAYDAVVGDLGAEGWETEAAPGSTTNFRVARNPREGTLCRGGERRHLMVSDVAGTRYVTVGTGIEGRPRECNADPFNFDPMALARRVPSFEFPEGTSLGFGSGGGGSSSVYTSASRVLTTETATRLAGHLASQLEAQGWQVDAAWSGGGSAGSTWRKGSGGELTWGTLEVTRVSEGTFDVDFTLAMPQ